MDLAAQAIVAALSNAPGGWLPRQIRPRMAIRFSRLEGTRGQVADRLVNRFWDYPRHLRRTKVDADVFHVADHSYAQLVHVLPAERTIVTCHDIDTFRCLTHASE